MALPIPEHSTRRSIPVDVSSKILYKVDAATIDAVTASVIHGWIGELDESIQATKVHIHEHIQSEFGQFQHQLESSKSVQARYESLSTRVDEVNHMLLDTETGIHATLVKDLTKHSALAQDTSNAEVVYQTFSNLLTCRNAYTALTSFVQAGRLPEAVRAVESLESLVFRVPDFLKQAQVIEHLKQKLTSTKARVQDQLSDAYSRGVTVSTTEIVILPRVQVRLSETMLPLPALLHSLTPVSMSNHLAIFRRDLVARFVEPVLQRPYSISVQSSSHQLKLSLMDASSQHEDLTKRFDNLSTVLNFLVNNFFLHLPSQEAAQFKRSLSKPIVNGALNHLLVPSLPSSFGLLPSFLKLLSRAVSFEEDDITGLLGKEGSIKTWSDGVAGHYERRRRVDILEKARTEILAPDDVQDVFSIIDEGPESIFLTGTSARSDSGEIDAWGLDQPPSSNVQEENVWNFDDHLESDAVEDDTGGCAFDESVKEADTWGLDEEMGALSDDPQGETNPDPTDAWGWDDDKQADEMIEDNAWDDPWIGSKEASEIEPPAGEVVTINFPKVATRLEKKVASRTKQNGHLGVPLSSPSIPTTNATVPDTPQRKEDEKAKRHDVFTSGIAQESYRVPKRTKDIMKMVEIVIDESKLFYASNLFGEKVTAPPPGSILSQSASSILDLYQAVYPVKHAKALEEPKNGFLFSNSCLYMARDIQRIEDTLYGQSNLKERLAECRLNLQVSSDSWFDETIERQQMTINDILSAAKGFTYTSDQDQYDECESAVNSVLQKVKWLARQLNGVLTKSKYHTAIGLVADASLSRMLQDILALPDITQVESHRLSELCRILNALEGLFSGEADEPSFVAVYTPHWLKFSYLSELLEASLADITYLFEQGALVDFPIDELVKLVRALFSDTPMRTNTINRLLNGHPAHA